MVLGSASPRVVGDLVVVPNVDERVELVQSPQIRVGLVERVSRPILLEHDDLFRRIKPVCARSRDEAKRRGRCRESVPVVFVDVIAEVDHRVQVVVRCRFAINVE